MNWALRLGALLCLSTATRVEAATDNLDWLARMAGSAQQTSYSGTFIYEHGGRVETSRITHLSDSTGDRDKLESMDAPAREIIRVNDEVSTYLPELRVVRVEHGQTRRSFPALLTGSAQSYRDDYEVIPGNVERVAGHDCRSVTLKPRDQMRFAHRLCADLATGLLLRAVTVGDNGEIVQQIAFTDVVINAAPDASKIAPSWVTTGWHVETGTADSDSGWTVASPPPGFHKIMETRRHLRGPGEPLYQLVYSDGLAAVSVFIEPAHGKATGDRLETLQQGAVSLFTGRAADYQITVVGEVPLASVAQIGRSVVNARAKP